MQHLKLANHLFPALKAGTKQITIRRGYRDIKPGALAFEQAEKRDEGHCEAWVVRVTEVRHKLMMDVTDDEAQMDGAASRDSLFAEMLEFYPDLDWRDGVTLILFF